MAAPSSRRSWPSRLKALAGYAAVIVILWVLTVRLAREWRSVEVPSVWHHPWLLGLHFGMTAVVFAGLAYGWHLALQAAGCMLTPAASAATWLAPNLGKYVPGKVLMFAGRIELSRSMGLRRAATTTAMALEHLMMLLGALPFTVAAVVRGRHVPEPVWGGLLALVLVPTVILFAFPGAVRATLDRLLRRLGRDPLERFPSRAGLGRLLLLYLLVWAAYGWSGVLLARAGGLTATPPLDLVLGWVAAWAIGFASVLTPGGLGIREATLVVLLAPRVGTTQGIAIAFLARITWTIVELIGVLLGVILVRRIKRVDRRVLDPVRELAGS